MSTTIKRIALVAVAALSLGVISVAPSSAAVSSYSLTVDANDSIKTGESATAVITQSYFNSATTDSAVVTAIIRSGAASTGGVRLAVTDSATSASSVAGAATTLFTDSGANVVTGVVLALASTNKINAKAGAAGVSVTNKYTALLYNVSAAGTYYIDFYSTDGTGAAAGTPSVVTWTVTVASADLKSDSLSTMNIAAGANYVTPGLDSASVVASKVSGTKGGTIKIVQANSAGTANESITVTIAGPGTLAAATSAPAITDNAGRAITVKNGDLIAVFADGTSGDTTITATGATSGYVFGTKTIKWFSSVPAAAAVTVKKAYPAAGKTTASAVFVKVTDAAGNVVNDSTVSLEPSTVGVGETTTSSACVYSATYSSYVCSVTGTSVAKFGKVSYKALVTAGAADLDETELYSAAFDLTFADIVATKVTITGPASATVGEKVTVTLTATEKNGYPVADSTYEGGSANGSVGGIFWNTTTVPSFSSSSFQPFNAGETITTLSGVATKDLYLPAVSGKVTGTWTLAGTAAAGITTGAIDKTLSGSTVAVSIDVVNPGVDAATDAANEAAQAASDATDAALAAADAADAATTKAQEAVDAVATLSAQVSKLITALKAQITTLTNLVIKIQKKVKA